MTKEELTKLKKDAEQSLVFLCQNGKCAEGRIVEKYIKALEANQKRQRRR
jgi:hypothetical protein